MRIRLVVVVSGGWVWFIIFYTTISEPRRVVFLSMKCFLLCIVLTIYYVTSRGVTGLDNKNNICWRCEMFFFLFFRASCTNKRTVFELKVVDWCGIFFFFCVV